ncbi:Transcriptional regulator containing an amidase domain and an AraC-type DNA-binding HTH domain [hydrothermal vent metagenome]|uniref:Transcriptional regulator containing an amidase domain and an AraC-type DNA-binding HTH domain n=1 Tax=hydrothermal vent metagenome TaxID=652676 RepID=A0A3B0TNR2_9ZZZZ
MGQFSGPDIGKEPEIFVIFLLSSLSMMSLAATIEPMRSLNRLLNRTSYIWRLASLDGAPVEISNGISLETMPIEEALEGADYLFVCGGARVLHEDGSAYLAKLREAARNGISIGALSTGSFLLARAGLLTGYRCTIHWENRPAFKEDFPFLECTNNLYEIDRNRLTCSGGTAAMDLMLHLIEQKHGREAARAVANQFHHERIRDDHSIQHGGSQELFKRLPAGLQAAIAIMQDNIEDTVSIPSLAAEIGLSVRQLQRLFLQNTALTPYRYYMKLRLQHARELLLYSDLSITEVAICVGFTSTSHFATCYKRVFGVRPSETRLPKRL